jgi:hypothetical protein
MVDAALGLACNFHVARDSEKLGRLMQDSILNKCNILTARPAVNMFSRTWRTWRLRAILKQRVRFGVQNQVSQDGETSWFSKRYMVHFLSSLWVKACLESLDISEPSFLILRVANHPSRERFTACMNQSTAADTTRSFVYPMSSYD